MIHKIYASDIRFKTVEFEKGLNVIVADRTQESDEKDSRNGIGKTTLIKVIHFCLGSDLKRKQLPIDEIFNWIFYMEIDLFDKRITASRAIKEPNKIIIEGDFSEFPIKPKLEIKKEQQIEDQEEAQEEAQEEDKYYYNLADWRKILGLSLFGLEEPTEKKYSPSFRAIISFFIRLGLDSYNKPFSSAATYSPWQEQVFNSFLLGLNWQHASDVQELKDKNEALKALKRAVDLELVSSLGELEAERIRLQKDVNTDEENISSFNVHPKYEELERNADQLTSEIHKLSNKNIVLERKLRRYKSSSETESDSNTDSLVSLYEDAGVHFSDLVKKTLEQAKEFHIKIVKNRKSFLNAEIKEINNTIHNNALIIQQKSHQRSDAMRLLEKHGALEEFTILQQNLVEKTTELESLKKKIKEIKTIDKQKKEIKGKRLEIDSKLSRDYEEARVNWEKAVSIFNENSIALYNNAGNLIINLPEGGSIRDKAYDFKVEIPRNDSEGVTRMKVFCYDLMLVDIWSEKEKIDFLIHDSTIFDGVDKRQVAHALELASEKGKEKGFQYICTFNSDSLPLTDFSDDFDINSYVKLRLNDSEPENSLFGFNFEI